MSHKSNNEAAEGINPPKLERGGREHNNVSGKISFSDCKLSLNETVSSTGGTLVSPLGKDKGSQIKIGFFLVTIISPYCQD